MEFFKCTYFFGKTLSKFVKKSVQISRFVEIFQYVHLFSLHNEPSPIPVGWKLWEE